VEIKDKVNSKVIISKTWQHGQRKRMKNKSHAIVRSINNRFYFHSHWFPMDGKSKITKLYKIISNIPSKNHELVLKSKNYVILLKRNIFRDIWAEMDQPFDFLVLQDYLYAGYTFSWLVHPKCTGVHTTKSSQIFSWKTIFLYRLKSLPKCFETDFSEI